MKKLFACLLATLAFTTALVGCGSAPAKEIDLTALATTLQTELDFVDEFIRLNDETLANYYMSVDAKTEYVVFVSGSGSTAEEIALFKAADAKAVDAIKLAAEARRTDLAMGFEDYRPEQMVKINNPVLQESGQYFFMVLTDDTEAAAKLLADAVK